MKSLIIRDLMIKMPPISRLPPKEQSKWLIQLLRWFVGGIAGYISSFSLFLISRDATAIPPLVGPIMFGQHLLVAHLYLDASPSYYLSEVADYYVVILSSLLWAIIGALLASGRRWQFRSGMIFLVLYVIAGGLSFMYYWFSLLIS
ncbi:MAG: hypothetical protein HZB19_17920 [Chloroflexi bacterium]|nr:hypothetical protein [Chloroflexota bacterium]